MSDGGDRNRPDSHHGDTAARPSGDAGSRPAASIEDPYVKLAKSLRDSCESEAGRRLAQELVETMGLVAP